MLERQDLGCITCGLRDIIPVSDALYDKDIGLVQQTEFDKEMAIPDSIASVVEHSPLQSTTPKVPSAVNVLVINRTLEGCLDLKESV